MATVLRAPPQNGTTAWCRRNFTTLDKVVSPPTVSIEPVTAIGQTLRDLQRQVNPNEAPTTYHFEYSTDGVNWTALKEESAGEGTSDVPVTQTVTGLTGHTTYHVRLVATNSCGVGITGCGANTSTEETFPTVAGPPRCPAPARPISRAGEATLHATIYPENEPAATYRFEYGPTAAYGTDRARRRRARRSSTPTQVSAGDHWPIARHDLSLPCRREQRRRIADDHGRSDIYDITRAPRQRPAVPTNRSAQKAT